MIMPNNYVVSKRAMELIVQIINANARVSLCRDSTVVLDLRDRLTHESLIRQTDLYTCELYQENTNETSSARNAFFGG
jgi:hypothetical protein